MSSQEGMKRVLDFWFPPSAGENKMFGLWYKKDNAFDKTNRESFATD